MSRPHDRDERIEHLACLIQRAAWLERKIEREGDPRGYLGRDVLALTWAIEALRDGDPDLAPLVAKAEQIAEDRLTRSLASMERNRDR